MQLLDLSLVAGLGVPPDARVESARRVLQELLLPGVNLVRTDFVAVRQLGDRRRFPHRLQGDLRLQTSIDPGLPAGATAKLPYTNEILASKALAKLMDWLRAKYDNVIGRSEHL